MPINSVPPTLESLAIRIIALENAEKENHESHKIIYDRMESIELRSAVINDRYERILEEIRDINNKLETIAEQPQKRWDTAMTSGITALVGGGIGYALSQILGGV